jgi:hypothetical protein
VEEEGEVFRKGTQLLRPEDFEADYAGEDLRKEVSVSSSKTKHTVFNSDPTFFTLIASRSHGGAPTATTIHR